MATSRPLSGVHTRSTICSLSTVETRPTGPVDDGSSKMRRGGPALSSGAAHTASGLPFSRATAGAPLTGRRLADGVADDPGVTYATCWPLGATVSTDDG